MVSCSALASNFQQFGIKYTSVGKAGFITACYIIIVPIIGIFLKKKCSPVYLDCCHSFPVWTLSSLSDSRRGICHRQRRTSGTDLCCSCFPYIFLAIDHFSPLVDGVKMSCIQFLVCGILSGIPALLFEQSGSCRNFRRKDSGSLCRSYVLWRCLHPADRRSEKYEPNCSLPDSQPGILYLCYRWMVDSRPESQVAAKSLAAF